MKKILIVIAVCISYQLSAQQATISGYVTEAASGETLIGASVYIDELGVGATTNAYGFYSITLAQGQYAVEYSYIGYEKNIQNINLTQDVKLDVELADETTSLKEVTVVAEAEDANVRDLQMSVNKLDAQTLSKIPTLLGEVDVIRSIQLLPGVSTVGEGAAGFNVRGGSIDQNLVLMDEAPVYNSSHLFGFFSVFNPDATKDVQLYKGGIPPRYGGRLSSILDVRLKEGNAKKFTAQGGIGTIFSRLSVEAPIVKDKASFIVAGRRSYIDILAQPFSEVLEDTELNFYDLTMKANYKVNDNNQVFLSGYFGRDNFGFGDQAGFNWGNQTATARWNHLFSDRLFSNITAYYSNYDYQIDFGDSGEDAFDWNAKIINYSVKPELAYYINPDNVIRFGGQAIFYEFQPANAVSVTNGVETDISLESQYALESGIFIENELKITDRLEILYGVRLSHFNYLGRGVARTYGEASLGEERPLVSEELFDSGESIEQYLRPEPRFAANYSLDSKSSLKFSYNRMAQYIHLLSNTTASTPIDIWTPSTNNIEPQIADQIALGYFRNFQSNAYELSTEIYYKEMDNIIDYIDGADLILNELVEGQILAGEGRAYGLEVQLKKNKGKFTGWVSYTLARTERLVDGINNGDWYPSRFDRTHNLSTTAFYQLNDRVSLSGAFVFSSGTPITFASSRFEQQGFVIPNNDSNARNNVRIPEYHRLDLSVTIEGKKNNDPDRKWKGQWIIGAYNVYNRRNPFSIYFRQEGDRIDPSQTVNTEAIRFSVIGSIIPSISYNFKFNQ